MNNPIYNPAALVSWDELLTATKRAIITHLAVEFLGRLYKICVPLLPASDISTPVAATTTTTPPLTIIDFEALARYLYRTTLRGFAHVVVALMNLLPPKEWLPIAREYTNTQVNFLAPHLHSAAKWLGTRENWPENNMEPYLGRYADAAFLAAILALYVIFVMERRKALEILAQRSAVEERPKRWSDSGMVVTREDSREIEKLVIF